jgi:hypothetical protein
MPEHELLQDFEGAVASEMLLVGHMGVPGAKWGRSAFRFRQNSGISLPGFCFT